MGIYVEKTHTDKSVSFSGAGVLVVEEYRIKSGQIVPCVLLVKNKASQELSDFGGGYDLKHKKLSETASSELLEESRNLIKIPSEILEKEVFVDIEGKPSYSGVKYRAYIIKIQNIASKYFNINMHKIDRNPESKIYFKETDSIHHIPVSNIDFEKILDHGSVFVKDIKGNRLKLCMRIRKILFSSKKQIEEVLKTKPLLTKENIVIDNTKNFAEGTYTFKYDDKN